MNKLGVYLHVPFCRSKCNYCDFYSLPSLAMADAYYEAVIRQLRLWSREAAEWTVDTVYLGGGTPTALPPELLLGILREIGSCFSIEEGAEWTVEANPATVTKETLTEMRKLGVDRLSFGLQSACEKELRCLGRIHDFEGFRESFLLARQCGYTNISADLMLGIPYQTKESLTESIDRLAALDPAHISAYCLRIEDNTPFGRMRESLPLPDEETERELYLGAVAQLERLGYAQYEISNFARPGMESRHNLRYWRLEPYLGFGPAAHSDFGSARFSVPADLSHYCKVENPSFPSLSAAIAGGDVITPAEREEEKLMLGLRLREGIPMELLPPSPAILSKIELWRSLGLCVPGERLRLTPEGMLLSNELISELLLLREQR